MTAMRAWSAGKARPIPRTRRRRCPLRLSYGEDKFRKLVAFKETYDPGNAFTLNGNIRPSVPAPPPPGR